MSVLQFLMQAIDSLHNERVSLAHLTYNDSCRQDVQDRKDINRDLVIDIHA